jgi:hypothetical protein
MTTKKDGTKQIKFWIGSRAINWVDPSSFQTAPYADNVYAEELLGLNTQTSTISLNKSAVADVLQINIKHRGKSLTYAISETELHKSDPSWLLDAAIVKFYLEFPDKHDDTIIGALFSTMFEGYVPPPNMVNKNDPWNYPYSTQTHNQAAAYAAITDYPPNTKGFSTGQKLARKAKSLPGVDTLVKHPVVGDQGSLYYVIMDLNDHYRWTRNQIADWIETLDIDTTFQMEYTEPTKEEL